MIGVFCANQSKVSILVFEQFAGLMEAVPKKFLRRTDALGDLKELQKARVRVTSRSFQILLGVTSFWISTTCRTDTRYGVFSFLHTFFLFANRCT